VGRRELEVLAREGNMREKGLHGELGMRGVGSKGGKGTLGSLQGWKFLSEED
jgi:hypothetical protein